MVSNSVTLIRGAPIIPSRTTGRGSPRKTVQLRASYLLKTACFASIIIAVVRFSPSMPEAGLDPSWRTALNQAVAQGLVFGRDILFTFGPYAAVYTGQYHPAINELILFAGIVLALTYAFCALHVTSDGRMSALVYLCIVLLVAPRPPDAILYSYFFLACLVVARSTPGLGAESGHENNQSAALVVMAIGLGLLPLIKGTLAPICALTLLFSSAYLAYHRLWFRLVLMLGAFLLSMCTWWALAGQPLAALLQYLVSIVYITQGYTHAMAYYGPDAEVWIYLAASAAGLILLGFQRWSSLTTRVFLVLGLSLILFVAFKEGFVRHDAHAVIAVTTLVISGALMMLVIRGRMVVAFAVVSVLVFAYVGSHYRQFLIDGPVNRVVAEFSTAYARLSTFITRPEVLKERYKHALAQIRDEHPLPVLPGTTDIYSYNQSALIASRNTWNPRPIFQSYSAYTPRLQALNRRHLESRNAPQNVFFRLQPIDGRLPTFQDAASWPVLWNRYRVIGAVRDVLILRRHPDPNTRRLLRTFSTTQVRLGQKVQVPERDQPVFVRLKVQPTILGQLFSFLYKIPRLEITVTLSDGSQETYRLVSGIARSGFLISPLVTNIKQFALLASGCGNALSGREVESFSVTARSDTDIFWRNRHSVTFSKYVGAETPNASPSDKSVVAETEAVESLKMGKSVACDG